MLIINGLVKKYKDFTLNCSMNVERGRITGLIGENGAGKSTTFKSVLLSAVTAVISHYSGKNRNSLKRKKGRRSESFSGMRVSAVI